MHILHSLTISVKTNLMYDDELSFSYVISTTFYTTLLDCEKYQT